MIEYLNFVDMSIFMLGVFIVVGFFLLMVGGDQLTKGASGLALILKVNPVIIGLTVVSMATSMPEFFTSFTGVMKGANDLAIGNIIGSNLANTGLILGVSALVSPVIIQTRLFRREAPLLFVVTLVFTLFAYTNYSIDTWEGAVLLGALIIYLIVIIRYAKNSKNAVPQMLDEEIASAQLSTIKSSFLVIIGSVALYFGAELLVAASVETATRVGVSQTVIGFTLVALGTSLPELAASLSATLKKESDLLAGNIVGSNLFNLLFIGGGVSLMKPIGVNSDLFKVGFPSVLIITIALWVFFVRFSKVTRFEGFILLVLYGLGLLLTSRSVM
tara:strand:+ start:1182 stop:2171 length:990 start_codon:yes stop_codon:yes gene_type:complete